MPILAIYLLAIHRRKVFEHLFVSVQTFNAKSLEKHLTPDFYDYIIIDEVHHAPAETYKNILGHFTPKFLLGLTATPERMDGKSIMPYFNNKITAEIRLPEAIDVNCYARFNILALLIILI